MAVSTTEAEYMASAQAVREALWLKKLLGDFGMPIYTDSQGALKLLKHPIASIRSKHIDVIHHFAREKVSCKEVCFAYCSTDEMVADCFTKPVPVSKLAANSADLLNTANSADLYSGCIVLYNIKLLC